MQFLKRGCLALFFLMIAVWGFAQSTPADQDQPASSETPATVRSRHRNNGPPCWRQAGMTPDMVNQRWKIEDNQKTSIAAVCAQTSTSPQQKHDKIEQIHVTTAQELERVIPADTLAKFNKCEADLAKLRPASTPKQQLGPCGGVIPTPDGSQEPGMEHQHGGAPMNE